LRGRWRRFDRLLDLPPAGVTGVAACDDSPLKVGVPVRVHDVEGGDLGIAHVPWPISLGDVLELGSEGALRPLRVVNLVDTRRTAAIAAFVTVEQMLFSER
jgi:hypothetical protein